MYLNGASKYLFSKQTLKVWKASDATSKFKQRNERLNNVKIDPGKIDCHFEGGIFETRDEIIARAACKPSHPTPRCSRTGHGMGR